MILLLLTLSAGDTAFVQRGRDPERGRFALQQYREAWRADPKDAEIGWRVGMAAQFVGHRLEVDEKAKEALFEEGRDAARAATRLKSDCAPCEFWTAINMALYGETVGVFKTLSSLKEIRLRLRRAGELDPTYAHGGPDRILGKIEQALPGILGGDNDRARLHYESAIRNAPGNPLNYLFLVNLLATDLDDKPRAVKIANEALAFPIPGIHEPEARDARREIEEFLRKSEGRGS